MNALFRFAAVLAPLALVACASTTPPVVTAPAASQPVAAAPEPDDEPKVVADADNPAVPKLQLKPEWLYGVVISELAAQRGNVAQAAETYLSLARTTRDPRLARRASEFALFSGQINTASAALSLWLELDPADEVAREQFFITLLRSGKLAESRGLLETMLQQQPKRAAAIFVQLARLAARQSDKAGTEQLVSELATRYPDLPEARFAHLAAAAEAGKQDAVDAELARLAQIAPQWDLPVMWQLERLRRQSPTLATEFLKAELARRPQASVELGMNYIRLLAGEKRYTEADAYAQTLLQRFPKQPALLHLAGLLAFQNGKLEPARQYLQAALANGFNDPNELRFVLAQLAEERKQPQEAQTWYAQVDAGDNLLPAKVRLAQLQAAAGLWQQAIDSLAPLAADPQQTVRISLAQSRIAKDAGQPQRAVELMDQALKAMPEQADLLYERALLLDGLQRPAEAEQDLRAILKNRPDDAQTLNALGYVLANQGRNLKEAQGYIEQALKAEPDSAMFLDSLGWVLYRQGHAQQALKYLQDAHARMADPEVAAHLGEVLWSLGRKDEARAVWDKARQQDPDHPVLTETLNRLKP
ncbi:tetratricopeptide (TPR) repeat protein [Vogesella perlucida]|nr:tetratricopeptide (TPR) repeat protein [Vogesella perlucida]